MKSLHIEFERRPDGSVVSHYVRPDGTKTWEKYQDHGADYFPWHDLIHFAVETRLGFEGGFYGLLADGWDMADVGGKGSRGRLPADAILVEHLAGLFSGELRTGHELSVDDFNTHLASVAAQMAVPPPVLSAAQIDEVRSEIGRLQQEWANVPRGACLSLVYRV